MFWKSPTENCYKKHDGFIQAIDTMKKKAT